MGPGGGMVNVCTNAKKQNMKTCAHHYSSSPGLIC